MKLQEINPERWKQIDDLFQQCLLLPTDQRNDFLSQVCNGDADLRRAIETLLSEAENDSPFLATPPIRFHSREADESVVNSFAGRRVGAYQLIQEIGRGGMGTVYLAERADKEFGRQVAIKLVKRGMDTDEILSRFRHERQILAQLNHPNIARMYDGGTTEDGLPYFVMEYVAGQPIDEYCNQRNLDTHERLQLFLQACAAVQYAHQNLVVHRDLKPGNILVTKDGKVKLLDFGIARVLDPSAERITATELRPMTLEFASPEQINGRAITTATDVWSLGVVFYQLLTGQHPFRRPTQTRQELTEAILTSDIERPSTLKRHQFEKGAARLSSDLDNIALMALRKEALRRYASVEQFVADIHRYLGGQPILAREDSITYRARKFILRHKTAVSAAFMVIAALLTGTAAATWQARVARAEQLIAERERFHAEQQRIRAESLQAKAESERIRAEEALARAETERKRAEAGESKAEQQRLRAEQALIVARTERERAESEKQRAETERVKAQQRFDDVRKLATSFLFEFHNAIQDLPGATPARQLVVRKALEYLDKLSQEAGNDGSLKRELANAYLRLGAVQGTLVSQHASLGDGAGELTSYKIALSILESLVTKNSADAAILSDLAGTYSTLGIKLLDAGDEAGALENSRRGLSIRRQISEADPANTAARYQLANAHRSFFLIALSNERINAGIESLGQAVRIGEELLAGNPASPQFRTFLAIALRDLAPIQWYLGDPNSAEESFTKARLILEKSLAEDPESVAKRRMLYTMLYLSIGNFRLQTGRTDEGLETFRQMNKYAEAFSAGDLANIQARRDLSLSYAGLGEALAAQGYFAEAIEYSRKSISIYEQLSATDKINTRYQRDLAVSFYSLSKLLESSGDTAQALDYATKAQTVFDQMLSKEPRALYVRRQTGMNLYLLAKLEFRHGNVEKARQHTLRAMTLQKAIADSPEVAGLYIYEYSRTLLTCEPAELRDPATALKYAQLAADKTRNQDPEILKYLALAFQMTGNYQRAIEVNQQALAVLPAAENGKNDSVIRRQLSRQLADSQAALTRLAQ